MQIDIIFINKYKSAQATSRYLILLVILRIELLYSIILFVKLYIYIKCVYSELLFIHTYIKCAYNELLFI